MNEEKLKRLNEVNLKIARLEEWLNSLKETQGLALEPSHIRCNFLEFNGRTVRNEVISPKAIQIAVIITKTEVETELEELKEEFDNA